MVRRVVALCLGAALLLLLAACQASAGVASETRQAATPALPTAPSSDLARPITSTVRDRGAGGVTVEATWLGRQADGTVAVELALDTHSVDLSKFDVAANIALRDDSGRELVASDWQDERRDSHHRSGLVRFPAAPPGSGGERVTLVVRNLAGVAERALTFEFQR